MSCLYLVVAIGLLSVVSADESVGVTMCCPKGRVLKLFPSLSTGPGWFGDRKKKSREMFVPKCVRKRRGAEDTLEGSSIVVKDEESSVMVVKNTGTMLPSCPLALRVQLVSLNGSNPDSFGGNSTNSTQSVKRVRLGDYSGDACGPYGDNCRKGNVYVDDKPVCDDDWDDQDAQVVCRELGFKSGGYATKESYFGSVQLETQAGWDQVRCSGRESSLIDCRHESHDDCGNSEGAGVVCHSDIPEKIYNDYGYGYYPSPSPPSYDYGYNEYNNSRSYMSLAGSEDPVSDSIQLTSAGSLLLESNWVWGEPHTYQAGEFCLAGVWEGGPSVGVGDHQALAVMCEPCQDELLCSASRELFEKLTKRNSDQIEADERMHGSQNVVMVGDKNADSSVSFDEFRSMVEEYVGKVFKYLDSDEDGYLNKDVSVRSLSAKVFIETLNELYQFADINQDDILSVEDAPPRTFRDRNDDGKISLREVFRVSLINLPAPLYRLYATLDRDKNEKISLEEADNFIKGTLDVIDQNKDCSIDIDELIETLKKSKLPEDYQLAMKLLGDYYITLADYCLRRIVTAADADGDKKTSLAELIGMKDPSVFYDVSKVAENMGEPHRRTSEFLIGEGRPWTRDHREAVREMWLTVLYDFVDNRKFDSVPDNFCKLGE